VHARIIFALSILTSLVAPRITFAELFDQYTNRDLVKAVESGDLKRVDGLTAKTLIQHGGVLPGTQGAFLIVKTNDGRYAKVVVQAAKQKFEGATEPILLIDRYATIKEGTDRTAQASGQNVQLYPGFHFSLDLGQVVPAKFGGDLVVSDDAEKFGVRPAGRAEVYLVTKLLPAPAASKTTQPAAGAASETPSFDGTYKLCDDGRRSGTLTLHVDGEGEITGTFASEKDGRKYDVTGKAGTPRHAIMFTIKYPQSAETFTGFLFTGDGKAIAGTSKLQDREAGFYAVRVEE
jgi:hypothetical protein